MKKILVPLGLSLLIVTFIIVSGIHNPIFFLSNDFYIESYQGTKKNTANKDIVIVNISDFSTDEIRDQIYILSQYHPTVIGIDFFPSDTTSITLSKKIQFKRIVLPILINNTDSLEFSINPFSDHAEFGFVQVLSPLFFKPFIMSNGKKYSSLPLKILQLFDESMYNEVLKRGHEKEIINYAGNIESFVFLGDLTEIKDLAIFEEIKNKIVLVGYTGIYDRYPSSNSEIDVHSTPKGKMFGVVMLANILHTLMNNYITPTSSSSMVIIILILSLVNVVIPFALSKIRFTYWMIKFVQLVELALLFAIASYVIHHFQISFNYEVASFTIIITPELSYWFLKRSN